MRPPKNDFLFGRTVAKYPSQRAGEQSSRRAGREVRGDILSGESYFLSVLLRGIIWTIKFLFLNCMIAILSFLHSR